jgi:CDP-glycerol glycerophosphotransferase
MNLLKKIIKHLIIRGAIISSIFFPINRRKILFMSFLGKNYSDNPRSISDYLIKSCEGRFKIIWVYNSTDIVDDNIVFVRMGSIKYYFHLHTSKVIIANSLIFTPFYKRKNQYVINTWHSSMSIKKIQRDVWRDKDKCANKMKLEEVAA